MRCRGVFCCSVFALLPRSGIAKRRDVFVCIPRHRVGDPSQSSEASSGETGHQLYSALCPVNAADRRSVQPHTCGRCGVPWCLATATIPSSVLPASVFFVLGLGLIVARCLCSAGWADMGDTTTCTAPLDYQGEFRHGPSVFDSFAACGSLASRELSAHAQMGLFRCGVLLAVWSLCADRCVLPGGLTAQQKRQQASQSVFGARRVLDGVVLLAACPRCGAEFPCVGAVAYGLASSSQIHVHVRLGGVLNVRPMRARLCPALPTWLASGC